MRVSLIRTSIRAVHLAFVDTTEQVTGCRFRAVHCKNFRIFMAGFPILTEPEFVHIRLYQKIDGTMKPGSTFIDGYRPKLIHRPIGQSLFR